MKRIAILCDGTWNRLDARRPTNVVRLARAIPPTAADGVPQLTFYLPGVGTGSGSSAPARWLDVLLGGAFGWGLDGIMAEAYRDLVFAYEPGDALYIFGFSRGAYTARSFAGLLRSAGIPDRARTDMIPQALELYRARGARTHPNSETSMAARVAMGSVVATSPEELAWRRAQGHPEVPLLSVAYLGVWDTVGALGLPGVLGSLARAVNAHYAFHDTDLSRMVAAARHAVALDERRRLFPPTLWSNLDALNARAGAAHHLQHWFAGDHGMIGGGSERVPDLGPLTLRWIAEGAACAGLDIDADQFGAGDALAGPVNLGTPPGPANAFGLLLSDRAGPERAQDVAPEVVTRIRERGDYQPGSLLRIWNALS